MADTKNQSSDILIHVDLDAQHVPENIHWKATQNAQEAIAKGFFLSLWDKQEKNTLSLNLWTKDMNQDEMKHFFYQSLVSMVESFERAVPTETEVIRDLYATCNYLAEKLGVLSATEIEEMIQKAKGQSQLGAQDVRLKDLI